MVFQFPEADTVKSGALRSGIDQMHIDPAGLVAQERSLRKFWAYDLGPLTD